MAEMAIGYGSEFQLLRYLGHHRNYLNSEISKVLNVNGDIQWLDHPVNPQRDSMDGEFKGIDFLKLLKVKNYNDVEKAWKSFWPQSGNSQNWDAVFVLDDIIYLVEAKAHIDEAHQKCQAGTDSRKIIKDAFKETCINESLANKWLDSNCYQLANRLAFIKFCETQHIKAEIVYILFYNGYRSNPTKNLNPKDKEWEKAMNEEFKTLELSEELMSRIHRVYIDCMEPKYK